MGVVITFSYADWLALFPEFKDVPTPFVNQIASEATPVYHRNDGGGPVKTAATQKYLFNLATAHLVQLFGYIPGGGFTGGGPGQPQLIGRLNQATEGSVSVGTDYGTSTEAGKWWEQTKYGAAYWAATKPYRTMRWRVPPSRVFEPWPGQGGWGFWW